MTAAIRLVLLVAFDRSGSSMAARVLARHPGVNLLFQPFNATEVHRAQWDIWAPDHRAPATEEFLSGLLRGELDTSYIASSWFDNHSTSGAVESDRVNLVKDTKLHFQIEWLKKRFPSVEVVGMWRDPRAITFSLIRNDFYRQWYGDEAFRRVCTLVAEREQFAKFAAFPARCDSELRRMGLIVAVRNDRLFRSIDPANRLDYEAILADPDATLNRLGERFGLAPFPFADQLKEDHNVVGAPFEGPDLWRAQLPDRERDFLDELFAPVGRPGS